MPGYVRIDCGLSYTLKIAGQSCSLSTSVRNAADREFYEGLQSKGAGRAYRFSASTRF